MSEKTAPFEGLVINGDILGVFEVFIRLTSPVAQLEISPPLLFWYSAATFCVFVIAVGKEAAGAPEAIGAGGAIGNGGAIGAGSGAVRACVASGANDPSEEGAAAERTVEVGGGATNPSVVAGLDIPDSMEATCAAHVWFASELIVVNGVEAGPKNSIRIEFSFVLVSRETLIVGIEGVVTGATVCVNDGVPWRFFPFTSERAVSDGTNGLLDVVSGAAD